jgi:aminomethyltransferase
MENSLGEPRKTPIYEAHRRLAARMVDFGGWWMPLQYPSGIIAEHQATRSAVGLFDVCHMGEVRFSGPRASQAVQRLVTGDVGALGVGRAMYTVACLPTGGIVDDLIVYRLGPDDLLAVVNAANTAKDLAWFKDNVGSWCQVADISDMTGLLAFQGPRAQSALAPLAELPDGRPLAAVRSFDHVAGVTVAGVANVSIARTGYTAEDGFELFCSSDDAPALWDGLLEAATAAGGKPVGLGARDTLRLEGKLSLYGNDLDDTTTPYEAGLGWVVKLEAGDFIGRDALRREEAEGPTRKLVGFVMVGRGIARHGYTIYYDGGQRVGVVTSGGPGPTVDKNIGLGYVPAALADPGTKLAIDCRGKLVEAEVVKGPFYRRPR